MFNPFKSKRREYQIGEIIKVRRGLTNSRTPRYVVAKIVSVEDYKTKMGAMLGLEIRDCSRVHYIMTTKSEILDASEGEIVLWKLENS